MSSSGISGATRLAAVIGWPVRHSMSPVIHNAAFDAAGLDWRYLALPVRPGDVRRALDGVDALGIDGLSVTMPHKAAVAAALDRLTGDALALSAVNCVYRDGDHLVGDNTDGDGFVDSLRAEAVEPAGRRVLVVGAGGAARAVVRALGTAGAAEVVVVNRDPSRAVVAASMARVGRVGSADDLATADLVVNATPVGMGDDGGMAVDLGRARPDAVVADLVYHPRTTPLLAAAEAAGLRAVGGLGMLVHQAARAFTRWTSVEAPLDAMIAAADAELTRSAAS